MKRRRKKERDQDYLVSGIIQIRVRASSAAHAVVRANLRAANLEKSPSLTIGLDNISTETSPSVALDDATILDDYERRNNDERFSLHRKENA